MVSNVGVIFIPKYISDAIGDETLITLAELTNPVAVRSYDETIDAVKRADEILKNKLSKYDIKTILNFNDTFNRNIVNVKSWIASGFSAYLVDKYEYTNDVQEFNDVVNLLRVNYNMSENTNNGYSFINADNTIFVILHEGFSNIVIDSNDGLKVLLKDLINSMISNFSDEQVYSHGLFKKLLTTK